MAQRSLRGRRDLLRQTMRGKGMPRPRQLLKRNALIGNQVLALWRTLMGLGERLGSCHCHGNILGALEALEGHTADQPPQALQRHAYHQNDRWAVLTGFRSANEVATALRGRRRSPRWTGTPRRRTSMPRYATRLCTWVSAAAAHRCQAFARHSQGIRKFKTSKKFKDSSKK